MPEQENYDVLIIGSGGAGLSLALKLAVQLRVAVLTKFALTESSTFYAQGGISAVLDAQISSIDSHIQDTLNSGAGLCDPDIVRLTVEYGKKSIDFLHQQGMEFTQRSSKQGESELHLNQEGGHSERRIVHNADATGKALSLSLINKAKQHANIDLLEHHNAIDLIIDNNCVRGAYVLDTQNKVVKTIAASTVALATGGANKVYLYTTNPQISTGDGIALAWRAGCKIANMEFMQFHPTCLYHPDGSSFLISEAIRGEGAKLILPDGSEFMHHYDARGELAPRDIVARAIDYEIKKRGIDCVFLDISHKPAEFIKRYFPSIYKKCLEFNIDITQESIPVVPAAHYTCGGVTTDSYARTDISGLYALGEVACTGLHGANRMASNSLLECLVFAERASESILNLELSNQFIKLPAWDESQIKESTEEIMIAHNWDELRRFMWDYVGIVRTTERLQRASHRLALLQKEITDYYHSYRINSDLLELRNLVIVADLIIKSALARKESRGLHYTLDYPELDHDCVHNTVLDPNKIE
jgi:L-aspartate oxidase